LPQPSIFNQFVPSAATISSTPANLHHQQPKLPQIKQNSLCSLCNFTTQLFPIQSQPSRVQCPSPYLQPNSHSTAPSQLTTLYPCSLPHREAITPNSPHIQTKPVALPSNTQNIPCHQTPKTFPAIFTTSIHPYPFLASLH
jgi:hypothetical protein